MTHWKPKQLDFKPMFEKHDEPVKEVWFICDIPEFGIEYDWEIKSKSVLVNTNPFATAPIGRADTIEQANDLINADFERRWQAMSEPQSFWKPIEQCPKVEFKEYFLYRVGYGPWVGFYKDSKLIAVDTAENLDIRGITHYAEIPPLEAGE